MVTRENTTKKEEEKENTGFNFFVLYASQRKICSRNISYEIALFVTPSVCQHTCLLMM